MPPSINRKHRSQCFRDLLRGDPVAAGEYAALKRTLAARFPDDREAYTDGKTDLIARLLAGTDTARAEAAAVGKGVGPNR